MPDTFDPVVVACVDARNGYRSGSSPTLMSIAADVNCPGWSRWPMRTAGDRPARSTVSPNRRQSAATLCAAAQAMGFEACSGATSWRRPAIASAKRSQ